MLTNDVLDKWDRESFFHPSTHLAQHARGDSASRIIAGAQGSHIIDRDGNRILDGFAGLYCVNAGYGRREITDAIAAQAGQLSYYHAYAGHSTETSITLAKMVMDRAPKHMSKVYFGLGGSDANETNIKLIWYYNNILGLTGLELFHRKFDLPLSGVVHTQAPDFFRRDDLSQTEAEFVADCVQKLEDLIAAEGADTIAAFIGEPVLGTGGIVPPPDGYWQAIQAVVTGFGRLGSMFGSDHYGMKPDFMTIAKGLTSAYAPLSGSIVSAKVWKVLEDGTDENGPLGHGWTYSAHPIGAAAGVANLRLIDDLNLIENARTVGAYLKEGLGEALGSHPNVGDIRGDGMLCALEFVKDRPTREFFATDQKIGPQITASLLAKGVIGRAMPQGDILGFAPPFCLTTMEADEIITKTTRAVVEVLGKE